jgi:hypothetical protein
MDTISKARDSAAFEDGGFSKPSDELVTHGFGPYHAVYHFENGACRIWECKLARKTVVGGSEIARSAHR